ncbi:hypothetical protein ZIOFF_069044 [Zingiber officinale]|uniref:Uncharacterized protein n=1 Tax=Zingiber officinale TaxID=94328 RepID=A0A8J5C3K5_ZINOF|nr:hypothetical protein ZIOFF_069044 [Zingiber officinale]
MCVEFLENSVNQCMPLLFQVYEWKPSERSWTGGGEDEARLTPLAVAEGGACMRWRKCGYGLAGVGNGWNACEEEREGVASAALLKNYRRWRSEVEHEGVHGTWCMWMWGRAEAQAPPQDACSGELDREWTPGARGARACQQHQRTIRLRV